MAGKEAEDGPNHSLWMMLPEVYDRVDQQVDKSERSGPEDVWKNRLTTCSDFKEIYKKEPVHTAKTAKMEPEEENWKYLKNMTYRGIANLDKGYFQGVIESND